MAAASSASGSLGSLAKGLGAAGLAVAGIGELWDGVHKVMSTVQQYRNLGAITGGSGGEGLKYDLQARAHQFFHPWMSADESRQMEQTLLSEGHHGDPDTFGTMREYYTNNLENRGMSIQDSNFRDRNIISTSSNPAENRDNAARDTFELDTLRSLAAQPGIRMSQADLIKTQGDVAASGIHAGMDQKTAERQATISAATFADDPALKGTMARIDMNMNQNGLAGATLKRFGGRSSSSMPDSWISDMQENGTYEAAKEKAFRYYADMAIKAAPKSKHDQESYFLLYMRTYLPGLDEVKSNDKGWARRMLNKYGGKGGKDDDSPSARAKKRVETADQHKRDGAQAGDVLAGAAIGASAGAVVGGPVGALVGGGIGAIGGWAASKIGHHGDNDPGVDPKTIDTLPPPRSLVPRDMWGPAPPGLVAPHSSHSGQNGKTATLHLKADPKLLKALGLPPEVPLTVNEQEANAGYGQATKNAPPPGNGITTRGAR